MASLGLIADYSSSSDEDQEATFQPKLEEKESAKEGKNFLISTDGDEVGKKPKKCKRAKKEKLLNPSKALKALDNSDATLPSPFSCKDTTSVFYNPFHQEQEAKKSMLEKHVKLTKNPKDVVQINGRKICYNYRKGRCKFGHKCKYAHDSDLSVDAVKVSTASLHSSNNNANYSAVYNRAATAQDDSAAEQTEANRKRKPGLAEGLLPKKMSRQNYVVQQRKETPWLVKR